RRHQLDAGEPHRRRQGIEEGEKGHRFRAVLDEGKDCGNMEGGVEHSPEPARRDRSAGRICLDGNRAVETAHFAVETPEETDAGNDVAQTTVRLVARIETDTEETEVLVVEERAPGERRSDGGLPTRIARRNVEAKDDVAPGGGVEGIARVAGR